MIFELGIIIVNFTELEIGYERLRTVLNILKLFQESALDSMLVWNHCLHSSHHINMHLKILLDFLEK